MFEILNRILGGLVAPFLYAIKSLFITLALILGTCILGLAAIFVLPVLFAIVAAENAFHSRFYAAFSTWLIITAAMLFLAPLVTAALIIYQSYTGLKYFIDSAIFGALDGSEHGLFFHVLKRAVYDFGIFNSNLLVLTLTIRALVYGEVGGAPGLNDDGLAALRAEDYFDLEDVPHSPVVIPNLQEQEQPASNAQVFAPLSTEELQLASGIDGLAEALENYKSLFGRLTELDNDIAARINDQDPLKNVMDEMICVDIIKPVLLVKQYLDEQGKWRAIAKRTKIIDGPSLDKWLSQHNCHPETREPMDESKPHKVNGVDRQTRYRVRDYHDMTDAQELVEASIVIRKTLAHANLENVEPAQVISGVQSLINKTFWGNSIQQGQQVQDSAHKLDTSPGFSS